MAGLTPRRVNSTSFSASSIRGIGRCVIARIAQQAAEPLDRGVDVDVRPDLAAGDRRARTWRARQASRRSVEERCSAAMRSSRTDSAIDVRRNAAPSGVFTKASTER